MSMLVAFCTKPKDETIDLGEHHLLEQLITQAMWQASYFIARPEIQCPTPGTILKGRGSIHSHLAASNKIAFQFPLWNTPQFEEKYFLQKL